MQHTTHWQRAGGITAALLLSFCLLPFTVWAQTETPEPTPEPIIAEPAIPFVHAIQEGENLTIIATNYDVTVDAILAANGLAPDALLSIGQALIIPGLAGDPIPGIYTVQAGDSLAGLAESFGTTAVTLANANRTSSASRRKSALVVGNPTMPVLHIAPDADPVRLPDLGCMLPSRSRPAPCGGSLSRGSTEF